MWVYLGRRWYSPATRCTHGQLRSGLPTKIHWNRLNKSKIKHKTSGNDIKWHNWLELLTIFYNCNYLTWLKHINSINLTLIHPKLSWPYITKSLNTKYQWYLKTTTLDHALRISVFIFYIYPVSMISELSEEKLESEISGSWETISQRCSLSLLWNVDKHFVLRRFKGSLFHSLRVLLK